MSTPSSTYLQYNLVSIDSVLKDIYRVVDPRTGMSEDDLKESAAAAAHHLFNYKFIEWAMCMRTIENYNVVTPRYYEIKGVFYKRCLDNNESADFIQTANLSFTEDEQGQLTKQTVYNVKRHISSREWIPMANGHSLATMMSTCTDCSGVAEACKYTYSVKGDTMSFSESEGYVMILYSRVLRDSEGNLLIPNIENVNEAIRAYVLMEVQMKDVIMHREGSLSIYDRFERRWQELSAIAQAELMMPSLPEWIDMIRDTNRLIKEDPIERLYDSHYGPERIYLGNDADYYSQSRYPY
jgi:hypothetical protein